MRKRIVQVSGLGSLVILPVQIVDAKPCRQRAHFLPVSIVTQIDVHLFRVWIFHPCTAPQRLIKQFHLFAVSRYKNVHVRKRIQGKIFRKRIPFHRIHVGVVDESLHHTEHLHHQQGDTRSDRHHAILERNRKKDTPHQIHDREKHIQEEPHLSLPVMKEAAHVRTETLSIPHQPQSSLKKLNASPLIL